MDTDPYIIKEQMNPLPSPVPQSQVHKEVCMFPSV